MGKWKKRLRIRAMYEACIRKATHLKIPRLSTGLDKMLATTTPSCKYAGDCQNYGPFLGPYYNTGPETGPNLGDPKRDHNFDNPPCSVSEHGRAR